MNRILQSVRTVKTPTIPLPEDDLIDPDCADRRRGRLRLEPLPHAPPLGGAGAAAGILRPRGGRVGGLTDGPHVPIAR